MVDKVKDVVNREMDIVKDMMKDILEKMKEMV